MQYTPQQLAGGVKFGSKVRIGNWKEDIELSEVCSSQQLPFPSHFSTNNIDSTTPIMCTKLTTNVFVLIKYNTASFSLNLISL